MASITAAIPRPTSYTTGIWSWLTTVDHKRIGILYGVSAVIFFFIGGIEAGIMRIQLSQPANDFIDPGTFNANPLSAATGIAAIGLFRTGEPQRHADAMAALATVAANAFPEGSDFGMTRAKEVIWENPVEFKKVVQVFIDESAKLAKITASGKFKAAAAQFLHLGKNACATCHKKFREKKK